MSVRGQLLLRLRLDPIGQLRRYALGWSVECHENGVHFEIVGEVTDLEVIAEGGAIRELPRLSKLYGKGRWRKMKGQALIRLVDGRVRLAELHWYEAHGVGKKEMKRKRYLD